MKTLRWWVLAAGLLMLAVSLVQAQDDDACPVIVQSALDLAGDVCGDTGRNQICYGNVVLEVEPQDWVEALALDGPGDIEDVADVRRIQLSAMDMTAAEWGIALMRLQANLPDALPGQNVLFVLFGDVAMESAVPSNAEPLTRTVQASGGINLRQGPSTSTAVVGGLAAGDEVTADGINADGSWLRVRLDEGHAWVFAELVTANGDLDMLDVVQATDDAAPAWTPMQAFYLKTGLRDSACTEAPASGVLVQTPVGAETVTFRVNEVDIALGSTAYLQAGTVLHVTVIEGQAEVTAFGVTRVVPAGARIRIPLNADGAASGAPGELEAYTAEDVAALPVLLLDRAIEIATPLTRQQLASFSICRITAPTNVNLRTGPGAVYPVAAAMDVATTQQARGQAQDSNGTVWWRLTSGSWVSSSVVEKSGTCELLQVIQAPPVPTAVPGSPVNPPSGSVSQLQIVVPGASRAWTDTGIILNAGQTFVISATGTVVHGSDPSVNVVDPNGYPGYYDQNNMNYPAPGLSDVALVGRIGDGPGFLVGTGGTFTADRNGVLQLVVNDNDFTENYGEFVAVIQVFR